MYTLRSLFTCLPPSLVGLVLFSLAVHATCYYPDGEIAEVIITYARCNINTSVASMCCNADNGDRCTPEGLCISGSNAFYRDMCTDQTWKAPECVKICTDVLNPRVTSCDDGTWCCGAENSTCCDNGQGVKLKATTTGTSYFTVPSPTSSSTSNIPSSIITSSVSKSSRAPASTSTAAPISKSSGGHNNSVAIGAGVGVSVGVVLIALAAALFFWRHRHNKKKAVELPDVEGTEAHPATAASSLLPSAISPRKEKKGAYSASTSSSPNTAYTNSAIEEGGVMSALAAGLGGEHNSTGNSHIVHPIGGEIHEIDPGKRIYELPVPAVRHEIEAESRNVR